MTTTTQQRIVRVVRRPQGAPRAGDFELAEVSVPAPGAGELLLQHLYLSIDPYLRPLLAGRYGVPPPSPGDRVPGFVLARVVGSDDPRFPEGCHVVADGGWAEFSVARPEALRRVHDDGLPLSTALGVLGIPGLTAWAGLRRIARPRAGETVLVSTAAGAVGSVVGQLAARAGCRVVGIAGGPAKCRIATDVFGFDACIDHRDPDLAGALRAACPEGVDVYFDNVGAHVLEAALGCLRRGARVVLCGMIGQYNDAEPPPGPRLGPVVAARARLQGLVVFDHLHRFDRFRREVAPLVRSGALRYREDVVAGIEQAPAAFAALMRGENRGKSLVRLAAAG